MRKFFNTGNLFKNIKNSSGLFGVSGVIDAAMKGPLGKDKKKAAPAAGTAAQDKAAEDRAAAEAKDRARAENAARSGTSSTLLSPLQDVSGLSTKRKTLGSA